VSVVCLFTACDANCATGCQTQGKDKCDTLCKTGYVLSSVDHECDGTLSSFFYFLLTFAYYAAILVGRVMDLARPFVCLFICLYGILTQKRKSVEKPKLVWTFSRQTATYAC